MIKKITLFVLLFSVKIASAQKIPSLYYHGNEHAKPKRSLVILAQDPGTTFVSFYNKELAQIWRKKTPQQINKEYRNKPNISGFSYSSNTGYVKLAAPTGLIGQILKKEFEFTDKELKIKGL